MKNAALATDLYQLTMLQSYFREGLNDIAVFDLFVRRLRAPRNYLICCGLEDALQYLETLHFTQEALDYLASLESFTDDFLDHLAGFRFTGDVYAVAEGTPVFAGEPLLEVAAPIMEAQLVETFLLNQVTFATGAASKASRVVTAAQPRTVVDFAMRRMHGTDAAIKGARAFYIAGVAATSNVLAGHLYGIPVTGTMAHSYIEAHDSERAAFRAFTATHPNTVLLVDTYDTLEGIRKVIRLADDLDDAFRVRAVRLDSGDLGDLAVKSRALLDEAGMTGVEIFASGSLDEHAIRDLIERGAPIDGFGVGTRMGTMADSPYLDSVYKLVEYAGRGRMKLSKDKATLPGRKQVFRVVEDGVARRDVVALDDEALPGEPLLQPVMRGGRRLPAGRVALEDIRARAEAELKRLPAAVRALAPCKPPYPVEINDRLATERNRVRAALKAQVRATP